MRVIPAVSLMLVIGLSGCQKGVDLETRTAPATPTPVVRQVEPSPTPAVSSTPAVKPGEVPEMMKRAFTKDEMDKAMEQLPPEIRSRLKGLSYAPSNITPDVPVKAAPSPKQK